MSTQFTSKFLLRKLDEPKRILCFTRDEVAAFFVPIFLMYWVGYVFWGVGIGVFCYFMLRKFKDRVGDGHGIVQQAAYKYLPTKKDSGLPDSSIDEYLT